MPAGQARGETAELGSDGRHRPLQKGHEKSGEEHRDDGRRDASRQFRKEKHNGQAQHSGGNCLPLSRSGVMDQLHYQFRCIRRLYDGEAKKVRRLPEENDHRDPRREPRHHGVGDVAQEFSQTERSREDQKNARQKSGHRQPAVSMDRHDPRQDGDEGSGGPANLKPGAAQRGDQESADNGGPQSLRRRASRCDPEPDGQRERDHADGEPRT